jgi:hypothetical protein
MSVNQFLESTEEVITIVKVSIYTFFIYLGIEVDIVKVLFALMFLDTALGMIKAGVLKQAITFEKLLLGIITKLSVLIIPMVIALVAKGLSFDFHWFVLAILNILIVAEGFSSIGNILSIKSKKRVENVDFITLLLKVIRKGLGNMAKRSLAVVEQGIGATTKSEAQDDCDIEDSEENPNL